jgi:hypothetical protein
MDMEKDNECGKGQWTWTRKTDMDKENGHGQGKRTWTRTMDMKTDMDVDRDAGMN